MPMVVSDNAELSDILQKAIIISFLSISTSLRKGTEKNMFKEISFNISCRGAFT